MTTSVVPPSLFTFNAGLSGAQNSLKLIDSFTSYNNLPRHFLRVPALSPTLYNPRPRRARHGRTRKEDAARCSPIFLSLSRATLTCWSEYLMDASEWRTDQFFLAAEVEGLMNEDRFGGSLSSVPWNGVKSPSRPVRDDPSRMPAIAIHPVFILARFYGP